MEFDFQQTVTLMGGIGGTIVGAAFFFRTIVAKWVDSGTNIEEANARRDVVVLLRDQVEELVALNKAMREESKLKGDELISLNKELREENVTLKEENRELRRMVSELRDQVDSLESRIDKLLNKG